MRKDSINQEAIEKAYLIFKENGHQVVDYDFSHPPTDYKRGTVEEPESTSKLKEAYNELLPPTARNAEYNALSIRDDQLERQIDDLQAAMVVSRRLGNFQQLQNQIKQMQALIKEKERINARQAVANLGAAQMEVYNDTMNPDFSEMEDIGTRILELEEQLREYMGG